MLSHEIRRLDRKSALHDGDGVFYNKKQQHSINQELSDRLRPFLFYGYLFLLPSILVKDKTKTNQEDHLFKNMCSFRNIRAITQATIDYYTELISSAC